MKKIILIIFIVAGYISIYAQNPVISNFSVSSEKVLAANEGQTLEITFDFDQVMDPVYTPTIVFNDAPDIALALDLNNIIQSWSNGNQTYTATYSILTSNVENFGIDITINDAQNLSGNVMVEKTYTNTLDIDTDVPTVNSVSYSPQTINSSTSTFTVTVNFSEDMNVAPAITFNTDLSSTLSSPVGNLNGDTYTVTYTVSDQDVDSENIAVIINSATDLAGNIIPETTSTETFNIDSEEPTVNSVSFLPSIINSSTSTFTVTVNFSEDMKVAPAITFNKEISSTLSSPVGNLNGDTYTVTYTVSDQDVDVENIAVIINSATDLAGNVIATYTSTTTFDIDSEEPTVNSVSFLPSIINSSTTTFTVTVNFSEDMNVAPIITFNTDLSSTLSLPVGNLNGGTYTATYTVSDKNVDVENIAVIINSAKDEAGNVIPTYTSTTTFDIDSKEPIINDNCSVSKTLITASTEGQLNITLTFNESMNKDAANKPTIEFSDAANVVNALIFSNGNWSDDGTTYTATYNILSNEVTSNDVDITVKDAIDLAGNKMAEKTYSNTFSIDTDVPAVSQIEVTPNLVLASNEGQTLEIALTFDEAMNQDDENKPIISFSDLSNVTNAINFNSGSWSADGTIYNATYSITTSDITSTDIDIFINGAKDRAGNSISPTTFTSTFSIDTKVPELTNCSSVDLINVSDEGETFDITLIFDEAMDETSVSETSISFSNDLSSVLDFNIGIWSNDNQTYTATYNILSSDATFLDVDVIVENAQDVAGNPIVITTYSNTFSIDTKTPQISADDVSIDLVSDSDNGQTLEVTFDFDEEMDQAVSPVLTFSEDITNTLTYTNASWTNGNQTYTATYSIVDMNEEIFNISIEVAEAQDLRGNVMSITTLSSEFSIDTENPIISITPADGSTEISLDTIIKIELTEHLFDNGNLIDQSNHVDFLMFKLFDQDGNDVAYESNIIGNNLLITIVPDELFFSQDYYISIDNALVDTAGNAIEVLTSATFTTMLPPPPTVTDNEICFGDETPAFEAQGLSYGQIEWYSDPELTDMLLTGNQYTPNVTEVGVYNYYVVDAVNDLQSESVLVTLTIRSLPEKPLLSVANDTLCSGEEIICVNPDEENTYLWKYNGTELVDSTNTQMLVIGTGTYFLQATNQYSTGLTCENTSTALTLEMFDFYEAEVILKGEDVLICRNVENAFDEYQWYNSSGAIEGEIKQFIQAPETDTYHVEAKNKDNRCTVFSNKISLEVLKSETIFDISPNPVSLNSPANLHFYTKEKGDMRLTITGFDGQILYSSEYQKTSNSFNEKLDFIYQSGIYIVNIEVAGKLYSKKIIVQ